MLLAAQLFSETQWLFTEFNDFSVLLQLIHRHEVEVLHNLKTNHIIQLRRPMDSFTHILSGLSRKPSTQASTCQAIQTNIDHAILNPRWLYVTQSLLQDKHYSFFTSQRTIVTHSWLQLTRTLLTSTNFSSTERTSRHVLSSWPHDTITDWRCTTLPRF